MTFLDDTLAKFKTELEKILAAEKARTLSLRRFSPSGSFISQRENLMARIGILSELKVEEDLSIFREDIIVTQPQNNNLRNALIIGGILLLI